MTVSTITTPPVIFVSRAGDTPQAMAEVYRQAAKLIEVNGYDPKPEGDRWDYDGPHNVSSALDAVALQECTGNKADAADLSEELHARLAGFLHLTGQRTRRTSIADLCDEVPSWEDCRLDGWPRRAVYRTQAEAMAVLESAAAVLDVLAASTVIKDGLQ